MANTNTYTGVNDIIDSIVNSKDYIIIEFKKLGKYQVFSRDCSDSNFEIMKTMKAGDKVKVATEGNQIRLIYPIKSVRIINIEQDSIKFEEVGTKRVFYNGTIGELKPGDYVDLVLTSGDSYCEIVGKTDKENITKNQKPSKRIEDIEH